MSQYYKKYMKKREEEKPSYLKLFIGAFLVMIVFFVIVATHLSSTVDTTIGENDEGDIKESGLGVKHLIDSRLRLIQMEDNSGSQTTKTQKPNIDNYGKTVQVNQDSEYKGQYQNTYGYNQTQQSQPYSPTYNNAKNQYNNYGSSASYSSGSTNSSSYANKTYTVPTPSTQIRTQSTTHTQNSNSSSPAHNIQKNLTPTGM